MIKKTFYLVALATGAFSQASAQESSAHGVPVPVGASVELQEAIRDWPQRGPSDVPEPPSTAAEWKALIAESDSQSASTIETMLTDMRVDIRADEIAGVDVYHVNPPSVSSENGQRLFLFVHGGAYVYGAGEAGLTEAILIAGRIGIPVLSIDYRMPPDHPFPAAVEDVANVYRAVLESHDPGAIIIGGTSAGGGLALASVRRFQTLDLPLPAAIYAGTPWADLSKTGDTLFTNESLDRVLVTYDGALGAAARLYAGDFDIKDPLISPVYGSFEGYPPTILTAGTRDMFLSDVARTHRKLRAAGVVADLHVYEGMSHAGYLVSPDTPESRDMYGEVAAFIRQHLD
jgi:acetyl esterase/lipase